MAKVFDLIHKINHSEEESRIPFEDNDEKSEPEGEKSDKKKKRTKVEVAFFYVLLFIVFFLIGAQFVSPELFAGIVGKRDATTSPTPSGSTGPQQGLVIDKEGESASETTKDLGLTTTPTPAATSAPASSEAPPAPATGTAKIQVLNGTTRTGAAAAMRQTLAAKGIVVASIGNYKKRSVQQTTIFYHPDYKTAAEQIQGIVGGILSETTTGIGSYNILVVVGLK